MHDHPRLRRDLIPLLDNDLVKVRLKNRLSERLTYRSLIVHYHFHQLPHPFYSLEEVLRSARQNGLKQFEVHPSGQFQLRALFSGCSSEKPSAHTPIRSHLFGECTGLTRPTR